ncbi:MAG: CpaF family protein, partial [Pseudomonadota bacterium]
QELTGMEGDTLTMQEIFRFQQTGVDERGRVMGQFGPTGIRPRWSDRIAAFGIDLEADLFGGGEPLRGGL